MKVAFTLAEVLVTLTILGIVATIVVPNVVQRYSDRQQITSFKRAYSILENALYEMYVVEGIPSTWSWADLQNAGETESKSDFFARKLMQYIQVEKYCGSAEGCFPSKEDTKNTYDGGSLPTYTTLNNIKGQWGTWTEHLVYGKMKLKNGMLLSVKVTNLDRFLKNSIVSSDTPLIMIDTNGKRGPNRYGYDVFFFHFNDTGIVQMNDTYYSTNFCNYKKYSKDYSHLDGAGCSTWILKHNNMDYKYRDITNEW